MTKFRKKPVVIEAVHFMGSPGLDRVLHFCPTATFSVDGKGAYLTIPTLEGDHRADVGDWIIKGVKGEFYPCKPDIFAATYDPVEEPVSHD